MAAKKKKKAKAKAKITAKIVPIGKSTTKKKASSSPKSHITDISIRMENRELDTAIARWKCSLKNIAHFNADWEYYDTGSNRWIQGNGGTKEVPTTSQTSGYYQDELSLPSSPTINKVRVNLKAVSKTYSKTKKYKKNGKTKTKTTTVSYWTASATGFTMLDFNTEYRPGTPVAPDATINSVGNAATVKWGSFERPTTCMVVMRYQDDKIQPGFGIKIAPNDKSGLHHPEEIFRDPSGSSYSDLQLGIGHRYRYAMRAHNHDGAGDKEWSLSDEEIVASQGTQWWYENVLSDVVQSKPADPDDQRAAFYGMNGDNARIKVTWADKGWSGDSYEIRYAETLDLLTTDGGYSTSSSDLNFTGGGAVHDHVFEATPGKTYYIRVVVKNSNPGDIGLSDFGNYAVVVAGSVPDAPTLGTTEPYYVVGTEVPVSWTHNSIDTSEQVSAEVEVTANGETSVIEVDGSTSSYIIDTSGYPNGTIVTWRVRTMGAVDQYSEWSESSSFTVLPMPTSDISVAYSDGQGGMTQLEPGGDIKRLPVVATLTMSGAGQLPIEWTLDLVAVEDYQFIDPLGEWQVMKAGETVYSITVDTANPDFAEEEQEIEIGAAEGAFVNGARYEIIASVLTDAGLRSESVSFEFGCQWDYDLPTPAVDGIFDADEYTMAVSAGCWDDGGEVVSGVLLDVYRINYDYSMTLLASGLENPANFTDPHPTFGTCTYRVVANDQATDSISTFDSEPIPTEVYGILIQWDDGRISTFADGEPVFVGEQAFLRWDIGVEETSEPDRELVGYIGRENPVAYFGTQLNIGGSWSANLVKWRDAELLGQLRKLQRWQGTCYVRETSGAGYEAVVNVTVGRSSDSMKVPVSLSVRKVEGE